MIFYICELPQGGAFLFMGIQTYKDLFVWQKSVNLVEQIYQATQNLPKSEQFGLTSQMRRAAVSVPSNIAEGYRRRSLGDYIRFLSIADGSSGELETQLIIAQRIFPNVSWEVSTS